MKRLLATAGLVLVPLFGVAIEAAPAHALDSVKVVKLGAINKGAVQAGCQGTFYSGTHTYGCRTTQPSGAKDEITCTSYQGQTGCYWTHEPPY